MSTGKCHRPIANREWNPQPSGLGARHAVSTTVYGERAAGASFSTSQRTAEAGHDSVRPPVALAHRQVEIPGLITTNDAGAPPMDWRAGVVCSGFLYAGTSVYTATFFCASSILLLSPVHHIPLGLSTNCFQ